MGSLVLRNKAREVAMEGEKQGGGEEKERAHTHGGRETGWRRERESTHTGMHTV